MRKTTFFCDECGKKIPKAGMFDDFVTVKLQVPSYHPTSSLSAEVCSRACVIAWVEKHLSKSDTYLDSDGRIEK